MWRLSILWRCLTTMTSPKMKLEDSQVSCFVEPIQQASLVHWYLATYLIRMEEECLLLSHLQHARSHCSLYCCRLQTFTHGYSSLDARSSSSCQDHGQFPWQQTMSILSPWPRQVSLEHWEWWLVTCSHMEFSFSWLSSFLTSRSLTLSLPQLDSLLQSCCTFGCKKWSLEIRMMHR